VGGIRRIRDSARAAATNPRRYLRGAARLPLEQRAAALITSLPVIQLADLVGVSSDVTVRVGAKAGRHGWSLGTGEQLVLQVLIRARGCQTAFEIGTFNGGTTRLIAETLPEDGKVWTIDLPPAEFDASQAPDDDFSGLQVGAAYRNSTAAGKITQILGNSLEYDFSRYAGMADLVLVDGGHEYANGLTDTKTALRLVRSGGLILWDDFEAYWHGLVSGICDAMCGRRFGTLAGTAFAVYVND
jgi:predicted O-methyltransferase YrrM